MKKILKHLTHKYVLIPGFISILCLFFTVLLFAKDKIFFCSLMAMVTIFFIWLTYNQFNSNMADDTTSEYLANGNGGDALVNKIRNGFVILEFLDDEEYYKSGVKLVAIDRENRFSLVLTKDCLYEGVYGSYNFPDKSAKTIKFAKGAEYVISERHKVDEAGMAKAGVLMGGLTAGAMNYADAKRINASGGASHTRNTGNYYMRFKVKGEGLDIKYAIVRKDYVEKLGADLVNIPINEGKYYNVYRVESVRGGAKCTKVAKTLNKILKYAVENE